MATQSAWKLLYGSFDSGRRTYVDFGSTDPRPRNWNSNLVCEPGNEIETQDFHYVTIGTDPPELVPIGFEAVGPDRLAFLCRQAIRRGRHTYRGTRPSMIDRAMHVVELEY